MTSTLTAADLPVQPTADPPEPAPANQAGPPQHRNFPTGLVRGPQDDPPWARPLLLALSLVTAGAYLWDLSIQG